MKNSNCITTNNKRESYRKEQIHIKNLLELLDEASIDHDHGIRFFRELLHVQHQAPHFEALTELHKHLLHRLGWYAIRARDRRPNQASTKQGIDGVQDQENFEETTDTKQRVAKYQHPYGQKPPCKYCSSSRCLWCSDRITSKQGDEGSSSQKQHDQPLKEDCYGDEDIERNAAFAVRRVLTFQEEDPNDSTNPTKVLVAQIGSSMIN